MKYPLKCKFCGKEVGSLEIDELKMPTGSLSDDTFGFEDIRCDNCRIVHGTYQECQEIFDREIGNGDNQLFKELMERASYKKKAFIESVKAKKREL